MHHSLNLFRLSALALAASTLIACNDNNTPLVITPPPPAPVIADTFVLTSGNKLVGFAAAAPASTRTVSIAVPSTETLLGGDFRPVDGLFYILTRVTADNSLKAYTVNTSTGALGTAIPLLSNGTGGGIAAAPILLTGSKVAVDFNPVANALRIVDNTGVNLRSTLAAGNNTFIDAPVSANIAESAYTNTFATACQTDLYYLNATQLLLSAAPNGVTGNPATPRFVGSLGVAADANSGFDVRTTTAGNVLTAALKVGGTYGLYVINQDTGAATSQGAIGGLGSDNVLGLVANLPASGATPALQPGNMLAITAGGTQNLISFNRPPQGSAGKLCSSNAITGLAAGDVIVGADTRPATGALTALAKNGTAGTLYTISAAGAASGRLALTVAAGGAVSLGGANFGVDFNPIPDRLRVVGDDGQNLRINPADGVTAPDTTLSNTQGGAARVGISAAAYTNSLGGGNGMTLTTALLALDSNSDALVRIGSDPANGTAGDVGNPNSGVVNAIANLTAGGAALDISAVNAFDINGSSGQALVAATVGANTTLFTLNLATGVAAAAGNFATPIVALGTNGAQTATVFGVTPTNKLVSFTPAAPATVTAVGTITGIGAGETVQGIDFRPSIGPKNGTLVAVTTAAGGAAKLYAVNPATAAATLISSLAADASDTTAPYTAVSGAAFGVDFNPLPDRLRTVSDTAQNLRSNVETGATFTDTNVDTAGIFGVAYSNNFSSTGSTELFYLAGTAGASTALRKNLGNPNDGVTQLVGDTTIASTRLGDLDIVGGNNGFALATMQSADPGTSNLYRINLATGAATLVGAVAAAGSEPITSIAIQLKATP